MQNQDNPTREDEFANDPNPDDAFAVPRNDLMADDRDYDEESEFRVMHELWAALRNPEREVTFSVSADEGDPEYAMTSCQVYTDDGQILVDDWAKGFTGYAAVLHTDKQFGIPGAVFLGTIMREETDYFTGERIEDDRYHAFMCGHLYIGAYEDIATACGALIIALYG